MFIFKITKTFCRTKSLIEIFCDLAVELSGKRYDRVLNAVEHEVFH